MVASNIKPTVSVTNFLNAHWILRRTKEVVGTAEEQPYLVDTTDLPQMSENERDQFEHMLDGVPISQIGGGPGSVKTTIGGFGLAAKEKIVALVHPSEEVLPFDGDQRPLRFEGDQGFQQTGTRSR